MVVNTFGLVVMQYILVPFYVFFMQQKEFHLYGFPVSMSSAGQVDPWTKQHKTSDKLHAETSIP
jgi:hypothetical protein